MTTALQKAPTPFGFWERVLFRCKHALPFATDQWRDVLKASVIHPNHWQSLRRNSNLSRASAAKNARVLWAAGMSAKGLNRTDLTQACYLGTDVLQAVLACDANPNVKSGRHENLNNPGHPVLSPLHSAALAGMTDCVELLLAYGATPNEPDLLESVTDHRYSSSLSERIPAACLLLAHGANPNTQSRDTGATAFALSPKIPELTDAYLAAGACPYQRDNKGTPAFLAQRDDDKSNGQIHWINGCLNAGVHVDLKDTQARTFLWLQVAHRPEKRAVVACLIEAGADIAHRDKEGNTPLHALVAYWATHQHDLKKLTDTRATLDLFLAQPLVMLCDLKNNQGQTPLDTLNVLIASASTRPPLCTHELSSAQAAMAQFSLRWATQAAVETIPNPLLTAASTTATPKRPRL